MSGVGEQNDLVSIIIVTRNGKTMTEQCVNSIFKNSDIDFEIIFVDNGSTDGTVKYLKTVQKSILIENKVNLGFAKACNQGIVSAKGNYIVLLNNDTVVTKGWLSGLLYWLKLDQEIGIVGPMATNVGNSQNVIARHKSIEEMEK